MKTNEKYTRLSKKCSASITVVVLLARRVYGKVHWCLVTSPIARQTD